MPNDEDDPRMFLIPIAKLTKAQQQQFYNAATDDDTFEEVADLEARLGVPLASLRKEEPGMP